jgi:hypothetical protein
MFGPDLYDSSSSDPGAGSGSYDKKRKLFERIHIKRDHINNVGNLICFPLNDTQILIVGGLNIGLLGGKSHIFNADKNTVNFNSDLEMPIPDISKFYYKFRDQKYYIVG